MKRSGVPATLVLALALAFGPGLVLAPAPGSAAPPSYTFDTDPIRLGMKAIAEGRLQDARARFDEAIAAGYQVAKARYGQAEVAVREGRYAAAGDLYREALKERAAEKAGADYPEAHAGLGLILLREGNDAEAAAEFGRALAGKARLWDAVYGQARLALKAKKGEEARSLLDQGKGLKDASDGADRYHYGMALYDLDYGAIGDAETEALLALSINPADPDYGTLVGEVYRRKGVPALAIDAYERALATPGVNASAPVLLELAHLYIQVKRYNDARDAYLKALDADSTYVPALHDLAGLYRLAGQTDLAARVYTKCVQMNPKDVDALVGLSGTAMETRQYALALDAALKAMAADSTRADVRRAFAIAGFESRDSAVKNRAAAVFLTLPDSLRSRPEDLVQLAASEIEMKQYAAADSTLDLALKARPELAEAWFQKGMVAMNTSRLDSAVVHFGRAANLDPKSALYTLNLGIALLRDRRAKDAIVAFRGTLGLNPDMVAARVLLAQSLVMADSLGPAEVEYRAAVKADPKNGVAWRGLGYCLIRKARYKESAGAYRSSTEVDPGNADGWAGLGTANLGLKDLDAAEKAFGRARAIDPANPSLKKGMELLNNARQASGSGG